jgi:hypothetical protein
MKIDELNNLIKSKGYNEIHNGECVTQFIKSIDKNKIYFINLFSDNIINFGIHDATKDKYYLATFRQKIEKLTQTEFNKNVK